MVVIVVLEYPWVMIAEAVAAAEEVLEAAVVGTLAVVLALAEVAETLAVVLVLATVLDDLTAGTSEAMEIRGV